MTIKNSSSADQHIAPLVDRGIDPGQLKAQAESLLAKITPGPWEVAPHSDDDELIEIVKGYVEHPNGIKQAHWVAECDAGYDPETDDFHAATQENIANANLIAAAPQLVRDLLTLVDQHAADLATLRAQNSTEFQAWCAAMNKVTRVEIIDENGRAYSRWGTHIELLSLQDDGRTLKLFLTPSSETES